MFTTKLADGTVHKLPQDLKQALKNKRVAYDAWQDITPLARNEWICLVTSTNNAETRLRRLNRTISQLSTGKRRPCCWAGCIHRQKTGRA